MLLVVVRSIAHSSPPSGSNRIEWFGLFSLYMFWVVFFSFFFDPERMGRYPPMAKLKLEFHEMSTPSWFTKDPAFAWGFWSHRLGLYHSKSVPHRGYTIMKTLAATKADHFSFTSNVDTHWIRSGFAENKVMECHGSTGWMQCTQPKCTNPKAASAESGGPALWSAADVIKSLPVVDESTFRVNDPATLPKCVRCGSLARPNVMMFSDHGFVETRTDTQQLAFDNFIRDVMKNNWKLAIIEIGAGEAIPTVRETSEVSARISGSTLIRINPRDPSIPRRLSHSAVSIP